MALLSVPLGKHGLERGRYIIHRFPFHTRNTLSNEVSIHQTVYFCTCNTLSREASIYSVHKMSFSSF